jgi:hypothetical protein
MQIIEVDQFTSSARNKAELDFDTCTLNDFVGGDSEAAKIIFGGHFERKTVDREASPSIGHVWFCKNASGKLMVWKTNYDSSD